MTRNAVLEMMSPSGVLETQRVVFVLVGNVSVSRLHGEAVASIFLQEFQNPAALVDAVKICATPTRWQHSMVIHTHVVFTARYTKDPFFATPLPKQKSPWASSPMLLNVGHTLLLVK